jgi:hypothetical protein
MKKILFYSLLLGITLSVVSCDRSDSIDSTTEQVATSGTWRVTLFTDSGNDETSNYAGYTFTFNTGGNLSAVKNGNTVTGAWSVNASSNKFNIDLGPKTAGNQPLGELTDDWKILSASSTEIRLTDDNATSNEFLTFTKN